MFLRRTSLCWLAVLCLAISAPAGAAPADNKVGGTGTILPRGGIVILVGVPGWTIKRIFVQPGQSVTEGTPLFELDGINVQESLDLATIDLDNTKKDAEYRTAVEAMTVKLLEMRLQHAKRDVANYRSAGPSATSEKEVQRLQQVVEESQASLDMEKVRAAQLQYDLVASVRSAVLRRASNAANLNHFTVRAPSDGTVLKISRHEGEHADGTVIAQFGDLSAMYVDAQIYQGDIVKVKTGMKVTVKNSAFPNLATGKVERIGRLIGTRSQLGDVMVRLDKNQPADRLVGMEVEVVIGP